MSADDKRCCECCLYSEIEAKEITRKIIEGMKPAIESIKKSAEAFREAAKKMPTSF